jgi:hypothetical protein
MDGLSDGEGDAVVEPEPEGDAEVEVEAVTVTDGDSAAEGDTVPLALPLPLGDVVGDADPEVVVVLDTDGLTLTEPEAVALGDPDADRDPELDADRVTLAVEVGEADRVGVEDGDRDAEGVIVRDTVVLGVGLGDGDAEGEFAMTVTTTCTVALSVDTVAPSLEAATLNPPTPRVPTGVNRSWFAAAMDTNAPSVTRLLPPVLYTLPKVMPHTLTNRVSLAVSAGFGSTVMGAKELTRVVTVRGVTTGVSARRYACEDGSHGVGRGG